MKFGVYGAGGHGRETAPLLGQTTEQAPKIIFIDDDPLLSGKTINGLPVKSFADLSREPDRSRLLVISVADPYLRKSLAQKCSRAGFGFTTAVAANSLIHPGNAIAPGGIFSPFSLVTKNISIGKHFHCNMFSFVAHDCVIGDYVTFAPRVSCNGWVKIEDFVYVGTGVVFHQGTHDKPLVVGRGSILGMGSVITKDVPPGVLMMGNPARYIRDLPLPPGCTADAP
ncbi:MAG: acetyltransferase [Desulfarculaceae bacterium]|nr:acetyltransferase [Desulfarculaceae bacterium]MCF8118302.1 acetyltransferase [Desulfarculaceae bacterium]